MVVATQQADLDPIPVLRAFGTLHRLSAMYPPGHPVIAQKLQELDGMVQHHLQTAPALRIDVIHGNVHLDGASTRAEGAGDAQIIRELCDLGVDSIHIEPGVSAEELYTVARFLIRLKTSTGDALVAERLEAEGVRHVTLGRLIPLDTRWQAHPWPDAPAGPIDPDYEESLRLTQETFESVALGNGVDTVTVRDLVQLLMFKVARSTAALGQILAVKQYENLTYCHSVNVAMLSFLLGREIGLDETTLGALVEAALLHDIGKTRVPLQVLKKPGALDRRERRLMEAHTIFGAEILVDIPELGPLVPTVALEHHRTVTGKGYPDLGPAVPHFMSQIVSVADIYEAITGARSYQDPALPEQACLILARLAGEKLNTALVKTFVNAITFFPIGSLVRTDRGELGVVLRTTPRDPLHPVIARLSEDLARPLGEIDTSLRGPDGYERHVVETLLPPEGFCLTTLLPAA